VNWSHAVNSTEGLVVGAIVHNEVGRGTSGRGSESQSRTRAASLRKVWRGVCGVCHLDFSGSLRFGPSSSLSFLGRDPRNSSESTSLLSDVSILCPALVWCQAKDPGSTIDRKFGIPAVYACGLAMAAYQWGMTAGRRRPPKIEDGHIV
jgi:hypothetical protein